jgi:hypothetical protein
MVATALKMMAISSGEDGAGHTKTPKGRFVGRICLVKRATLPSDDE